MSASGFIIKNLNEFKRDLGMEDQRRIKAAHTAVRVEAFALMKALKTEIRSGAPGGKSFTPLTEIAKAFRRGKKAKAQKPLYRLAAPVRYRVDKNQGNMAAHVGWVDTGKQKASSSWQGIVKMQQTGRQLPISGHIRESMLKLGQKMKKQGIPEAKYLFLRKSTTDFDIPARPIMAPFWEAHESQSEQNIIANFARKMRGERI